MSDPITVLGIDLACRSWRDTGTAMLSFTTEPSPRWEAVRTDVISWPRGEVTSEAMADAIDSFAMKHRIHAVSLDGPQGWREPEAEDRPGVGRWCEYLSRTQGKTGTFGVSYPGPQLGWIQFCIKVFERLVTNGNGRLVNEPAPLRLAHAAPPAYWLVECFPTRTWRSSNLTPLPGKNSTSPADVPGWAATLRDRYGLPQPNAWSGSHDDLQAVVACLPAAALLGAPCVPLPLGNQGRWIDAVGGRPRHWVEGLIWDASAPPERLGIPVEPPRRDRTEPAVALDPVADNPLLVDDREDGSQALARGVRLFDYLVGRANAGDPVGIGYAQFVCVVHGVTRFDEVANRQYLPSDTPHVVGLAHQVTAAAGGRRPLARGSVVIQSGMDTFVWQVRAPHPRPQPAFQTTPYTEQDWRVVFPDDSRRLITQAELAALP